MPCELVRSTISSTRRPAVGAGARDRTDLVTLLGRRLLRTPTPIVRVKRPNPRSLKSWMTFRTWSASVRYNRAICGAAISVAEANRIIAGSASSDADHRSPTAPAAAPPTAPTLARTPREDAPSPPGSDASPIRRLSAVSGPTFPRDPLGIRRIMFAVDDLDDVIARLRNHGAELVGGIAQYEDGSSSASCVAPRASSSDWPSSSVELRRAWSGAAPGR